MLILGDMSKILTWRNDGDMPYCQILLPDGDSVAITLSGAGMRIDRLDRDGTCARCCSAPMPT